MSLHRKDFLFIPDKIWFNGIVVWLHLCMQSDS